MAELRRTFVNGRMNKDLDERIVPEGEYRDAMNIEVSTSENSDVGTAQAVMGNTRMSFNNAACGIPGLNMNISFNAVCVGEVLDEKNDKIYWFVEDSERPMGQNFQDRKDLIIEFDVATGTITPVVVDLHITFAIPSNFPRVLNFNRNFPITGINIIDDFLFWTDNNSEPKKVSIKKSKSGSIHPHMSISPSGTPDFSQHTNYVTVNPNSVSTLWLGSNVAIERRLEEKHITVIKESPLIVPKLQMKNVGSKSITTGTLINWITDPDTALMPGPINGTWNTNPFFDINGDALQEAWLYYGGVNSTGGPQAFTESNAPIYKVNDIVIFTSSCPMDPDEPEEVICRILEGPDLFYGGYRVEIKSMHPNINSSTVCGFTSELETESSYFEYKFPRFATRYKYDDDEYSAFSPFSEVAFLPSEFDYLPKEAYNLGMTNNLRFLALKDFVGNDDLIPDGVTSIDILYKESDSPNIYLVKTIKRNSKEWTDRWDFLSNEVGGSSNYTGVKGYVQIESETIHAAIPSNQFIRPWDNVPRKALAQEITGNRLLYGNYLQNYNMNFWNSGLSKWEDLKVDLELKIKSQEVGNILAEQHYVRNAYSYSPAKSIKTLRTYQLGVVYTDKYGRQTPVFSDGNDGSSSKYLEKLFASKANKLQVKAKNAIPAWAESFKFFVKETSNEYYNLSMDRWYDAKDGGVWLSFPSAERNKIDEDTYLVLKKRHNSDTPVLKSPAKYKIVAIENEAPRFIKLVYSGLGTATDQVSGITYTGFSDGTNNSMFGEIGTGYGWPRSGLSYFYLDEANSFDKAGWDESVFGSDDPNLYLRFRSSQLRSKWYKIASVSKIGNNIIRFDVTTAFDTDVDAITNTSNGDAVDPLGTDVNVFGTNSLEIRTQTIDERPEFEGRFFVKIRRDTTFDNEIKSQIQMGTGSAQAYQIIAEKEVKYIDSYNAWSHYGEGLYDFSDPTEQGYWDGWNCSNRDILNNYNLGSLDYRYFFNASREQSNASFFGNDQWSHSLGYSGIGTSTSGPTDWDHFHSSYIPSFGNIDYAVFQAPQYATSNNIKGEMNTGTYGATQIPNIQVVRGKGEEYWENFVGFSNPETHGKTHWYIDRRVRFCEMNQIRETNNILGEAGLTSESFLIWGKNGGLTIQHHDVLHGFNNWVTSWFGIRDGAFGDLAPTTVSNAEKYGGYVHTLAMKPPNSSPWPNTPTTYDLMDYVSPTFHGIQTGSTNFGQAYNEDPKKLGNPSLSDNSTGDLDGYEELQNFSQGIYDSGSGVVDTIDLSGVICGGPNGPWEGDNGLIKTSNVLKKWAWMKQWQGSDGQYVEDIAFINKLTTGGTLWKWAQDPHVDAGGNQVGIIYQTTTDVESCGSIANFIQRIALNEFNPGFHSSGLGHNEWPASIDQVCYLGASAWWSVNKSARWTFKARKASDHTIGIGGTGPNFYSPTNDPRWIQGIGNETLSTNPWGDIYSPTSSKTTPPLFNPLAASPGIRSDGMRNGETLTVGPASTQTPINSQVGRNCTLTTGYLDNVQPGSNVKKHWPGEVTWLILEPEYDEDAFQPQSENPAIWETEPKKDVGLDVYHEVSQVYPTNLDLKSSEMYIPIGAEVSCYRPIDSAFAAFGTGLINLGDSDYHTAPMRIKGINDNVITLIDSTAEGVQLTGPPPLPPGPHDFNTNTIFLNEHIAPGDILTFTHIDGSTTSAIVQSTTNGTPNYTLNRAVHNMEMTLPWFNCWAFGNGVESNRIRDDYNAVFLDKGPRVSTTLEDIELGGGSYKYKEERRGSGLIYSGIFNSTSGVNNLNQFIMAEKITKDLNPTYGTIQKLFSRNTDIVTFCEDRVIKVLANKDAVYNADGNPQLTANINVLGQTVPFSGDFGISKNPESFASEHYRAYFTDKNRGTVLRLSQDGLTPISNYGMKDWFSDNLKINDKIIGSFDEKKTEYNVTLKNIEKTVSFNEDSKGWVSFKSFVPERGVSINSEYYTFKRGHLWKHHSNPLRRNYYGSKYDGFGNLSISSVTMLFNNAPELVKSFNTLNYEGSQARITQDITFVPPQVGGEFTVDYYDNYDTSGGYIPGFLGKLGWYVNSLTTNLQEIDELEFKNKEGKWFSTVKGQTTNLANLDTSEFSVQGVGNANGVTADLICGCGDGFNNLGDFYGFPNAGIPVNYNPAANHDCSCNAWRPLPPPGDPISNIQCCVYCEKGCTDPSAYNYDANAWCYTVGPGAAPNYTIQTINTSYSADDGSCLYCTPPSIYQTSTINATMDMSTCLPNSDGGIRFKLEVCQCACADVEIKDANGNVVWAASCVSNNVITGPTTGLPPGVYTITITDCNSCDSTFTITVNSTNVTAGCMDNGSMDNTVNTGYANNQPVSPTNTGWGSFTPGFAAANYDPFATCDDGTCSYAEVGCTDPNALNYSVSAIIDDGSCIYCSFVPDSDFGYSTYAATGNYSASPSATSFNMRVYQFNAGESSQPGGAPNMNTGQVWPAAALNLPEPWRYKHPSIGQGSPWPQTPDPANPEWFGYYSDKYMFWFTEPGWGGNTNNGVDHNYYFGIPPVWNDGSLIDQSFLAQGTTCPSSWVKPGIVLELKGGRDDGSGGLINVPSGGPQAQNVCTTTAACFGQASFDPGRRPTNYAGMYTVVKNLTPTACYKVEITVARLPVDLITPAEPWGYDTALLNPSYSDNFGELRISAGPMDNSPQWTGQGSYPNGTMLWGFNAPQNYYSSATNCSNSPYSNISWNLGPSITQGPITYSMEFTSNTHGEGYLGLDFRHLNFNGGSTSGSSPHTFTPLADKIMITNVCVSESRGGVDVDFDCPACKGGVGAGFSSGCAPYNFGETSLGQGNGMFTACGGSFGAVNSGLNNFNNTCNDCCFGCNVPGSINYDPGATCNDGSCIPCSWGCTDNGNMSQNWWDGTAPASYDYAFQTGFATYPGGTNNAASGWYVTNSPQAINYDSNAICDDGSCEYDDVYGCTNSLANNHNPWATIDDGSCTYTGVNVCLDPYACNFNAPAHDSGTGTDCVGTANGTNYSCCTYSTVADPDASEGTPLNPMGNGMPHIYAIKKYYLPNQSNQAMWTIGSVIFDTSNNTCVITGVGLGGTYKYRHCDECPGNQLEIFCTPGGGGSNVSWQSGTCDPFTNGCGPSGTTGQSVTGCWQSTYLRFNYSSGTFYWSGTGFPTCDSGNPNFAGYYGYQIY